MAKMEDTGKENRLRQFERSVGREMRGIGTARAYNCAPAGEIDGITFVNDSASVTLEQTASVLAGVLEPVVWIVEANGRHSELSLLGELVKAKVKAVVAVGNRAYEVHDELWQSTRFFAAASTWEEAVELGVIMASEGDTVLFSPACRAVEPFENHRDRGAYFDQIISLRNP